MNEAWIKQWRRGAELECMRSVELAEKLRGMGWVIRGRRNKAAYKNAILHLEEYDVPEEIVDDLKLERIEPELELEAAAIGGDGGGAVSLDVAMGSGIVADGDGGPGNIAGGGEAGQKPMGRDEALAVVRRVAAASPFRNYEG